MSKVVHRPLSILVSVPAGMLAGAIFKRIWRVAAREEQVPSATDARRGWTEILIAFRDSSSWCHCWAWWGTRLRR